MTSLLTLYAGGGILLAMLAIIHKTQGHKSYANQPYIAMFEMWL